MSSRRTQLETAENGSSGSGWARIEKEGRLGRRGLRQERGGKGRGWMDGRMDGKERMGSFAILSSLVAGIDRRIKPRQTYFPWLVSVCWLPTQCFVTRILASGQAHFKWTYYIMSLANQCFVGT